MVNRFQFLLWLLMCLFPVITVVTGQAQLTPSQDAYTDSASPATNFGTKTVLDIGSASQTTYIQFDLSAIPAGYTGSDISKATLKLFVNSVSKAGSFNVNYVNGSWTENKITANLAPALGTTIVASVPVTTSNKNDYINIDITAALQAWLNGTANDGIALVANSGLDATFDSKESTTTSHAAELDVFFAGGTGGITGVTTASGSGLIGGGTKGTLNISLLNSCSSGQILQWNGSAWVCANAKGSGTITGVTAGTGLTGGGKSGNVTLSVDTTKVPQLAGANTFTGSQTINGNLSATGAVTGGSFQIGSSLFAFGSSTTGSAYLGFAGNPSSTGTFNTAVGYLALGANTLGYRNTAIGNGTLGHNITGGVNTAVGDNALFTNTTGADNAAIGSGALHYNTTGINNAAMGDAALAENTTGLENTALGYAALFENFTGNELTCIGAHCEVGVDGLVNSTAIGADSRVDVSNALILGARGSEAVTVGIGTSSPYNDYALDVETINGNGIINGGVVVNASGGNLYLGMTNTVHKFRVDTNGVAYANGGFQSSGADFAESFAVRGKRSEYEPGDVLQIDTKAPRHLALSHHAYATLVAGIYSTKPGLLASPHTIDDPATKLTEVPLAVIGVVPCKVSTENGPIRTGDLLVTSSRPGYAMRGTDRSRMLGAVVGKALEPLAKGIGLIQVLVTLQ
jgi:hypothetical protein